MLETLLILALILFLGIVARGAPYVPTHTAIARQALELLQLKRGSVVVDLGSGDGVVLKSAVSKGLKAVGYELNPVLCIVSILRCWKYRDRVQVKCRDFMIGKLPVEADAFFIFQAGPYMRSITKRIDTFVASRKDKKRLRVISYGFELPGKVAQKRVGSLYLYEF